jgi:stress-induced morphogen
MAIFQPAPFYVLCLHTFTIMAASIFRPVSALRVLTITRSLNPSFRNQTRNLSCSVLNGRSSSLNSSYHTPSHSQTPSIRQACLRSYRNYSTESPSTIQGTIAKGAAGVPDEAQKIQISLSAPEHLDDAERSIFEKLGKSLNPVKLEVQDISGGCGSMYGIEIVSEAFRGLSMLKQQRLVNQVLGDDIKGWHGVQLKTRAP